MTRDGPGRGTPGGNGGVSGERRTERRRLLLFVMLGTFTVSWLLSYGGIRAPDSEVVFRTAQALIDRGTFALQADLPWHGFGVAPGKDGRRYSMFGPAESIVLAPFVGLAETIQDSPWYDRTFMPPTPSHYVGDGLRAFMTGTAPSDPEAHALRFMLSWFNPLLNALAVGLLSLILERLTGSLMAGVLVSILYGLGTLALAYAGTFFSEPLATLLCLLSLYLITLPFPEGTVRCASGNPGDSSFFAPGGRLSSVSRALFSSMGARSSLRMLAGGVALGLGCATHLTAVLFAPFLLIWGMYQTARGDAGWRRGMWAGVWFSAGLAVELAGLAYYDYARFGSVWETGRTVPGMPLTYGHFVAPWPQLSGLLWDGGKGLIWYSPAVLLGALSWPSMLRRHAVLAGSLAGAVLFRVLFIASRSDWSGGFCLGPRYLVMALPFMLIPCAYPLASGLRRRPGRWILLSGVLTLGCVAEQLYFSVGEVFSFQHWIKWMSIERDIDVFATEQIYRAWEYAPLLHLLSGKRGPWTLQAVPWTHGQVWAALAAGAALIVAVVWGRWFQEYRKEGFRESKIARGPWSTQDSQTPA